MGCTYNESFCAKGVQSVSQLLPDIIDSNEELKEILGDKEDPLEFLTDLKNTNINISIWDLIKKIFIAIHNYGDYGTRNYPAMNDNQTITGFPDVEQFKTITPEAYNDIINILKKNNLLTTFNLVSKHNLILGSYSKDLKDYINNYKIDLDRCNSCNITCYSNDSCSEGAGCFCQYCEICNTCQGHNPCGEGDTTCNVCQAEMSSCSGGCMTGCEHGCQSICEYACEVCQDPCEYSDQCGACVYSCQGCNICNSCNICEGYDGISCAIGE